MMYFIDDVVKGTHPLEAGWRETDKEEDQRKNQKSDLLEANGKRTRLSLDNLTKAKITRTTDLKTRRLAAICIDISRALQVEESLKDLVRRSTSSSCLQGSIVAIGWWRMLETSDFPVDPSRVIEAGFNFSDWFVNVAKCSFGLSLEVAQTHYPTTLDNIIKMIKEMDINFSDMHHVDSEIARKVKFVLQWDKALGIISDAKEKIAVETLAFFWFVDFLCEINSILQDESYVFIQSTAWALYSSILNRKSYEIVEDVNRFTEELCDGSMIGGHVATDWDRIIRLPW
jgi:hypothetical protein